MNKELDVFLHNKRVGQLKQDIAGRLSFQYLSGAMPLSVSLPFKNEPYGDRECSAYFSGLLPDETIRETLGRYFHISPKNIFSLLNAIGGECAGAVSFYPAREERKTLETAILEPLPDDEFEKILLALAKKPLLSGKHIRLSLAGAQKKLAIYRNKKGEIYYPSEFYPSTHIVKPTIEGLPNSVHNEYFCMRLASKIGLAVPATELYSVKENICLLIERYDRKIVMNAEVNRIHQEDFCQALGIGSELKYESENGPSIKKCFELIDKVSIKPALDRLQLLKAIIFNYLIGNADAHGKNFSLLHYYDQATFLSELAPFYDLISTTCYPEVSAKMAMKIGKEYDPAQLRLKDWQLLVENMNIKFSFFKKELKNMTDVIVRQGIDLKHEIFMTNKVEDEVFNQILSIIAQRIKLLDDLFI